jgi:UDP-2,3-diacylglucosamine pyrophosphatase LpxH
MAYPKFIQALRPEGDFEKKVRGALNDACDGAGEPRVVELDDLRAVIFSDHHRGQGDGADDFKRCEQAYCAALGHYLDGGHELWLLGDVEELWENNPAPVLKRYENVLALEKSFGAERLYRFFGNHDIAWNNERAVRSHLADHLPPGVPVREALNVKITDGGEPLGTLFLVHGHQGTPDAGSKLAMGFSRLVVRKLWAPLQRFQSFASTAPSQNAALRGRLDRVMARWADERQDPVVMIAGHTHRPVVPGTMPPDVKKALPEREREYAAAKSNGNLTALADARAALELARVRVHRDSGYRPPKQARPAYFNSGCCSYGDGDVTGLVIEGGRIKLVRWLDNDGKPAAQVLADRDLRKILSEVQGAP